MTQEVWNKIINSEMLLIGIGTQLSVKEDNEKQIDEVYDTLAKLAKGRNCFVITSNTDQKLLDGRISKFLTAAPKVEGQEKQWEAYMNWLSCSLTHELTILELGEGFADPMVLLFETIFVFQKEEAWKEKTRRREYMISRQLQYYAKQYEALSHFQETMRKERHERKNRNMELLMLAQKGDFDALICRLNEEQSLMTPHSSTTGNRTVDAVLDFEKAVAREKKIQVEESISIPREMEVADSVLCGVLGNALDNAIEACDRVSEKERLVKIFMKVERKNLFIEIKNRYDGTIFKTQDGRLISRKENPQEHGMGLRIMHELLEHADGNVETMWDEHVFTLRVMIYHVI